LHPLGYVRRHKIHDDQKILGESPDTGGTSPVSSESVNGMPCFVYKAACNVSAKPITTLEQFLGTR
jgi:hypothetical protein